MVNLKCNITVIQAGGRTGQAFPFISPEIIIQLPCKSHYHPIMHSQSPATSVPHISSVLLCHGLQGKCAVSLHWLLFLTANSPLWAQLCYYRTANHGGKINQVWDRTHIMLVCDLLGPRHTPASLRINLSWLGCYLDRSRDRKWGEGKVPGWDIY